MYLSVGVSLIRMEPALHDADRLARNPPEHQGAAMATDSAHGESTDFLVRQHLLVSHKVGNSTQTGAANDPHLWLDGHLLLYALTDGLSSLEVIHAAKQCVCGLDVRM